MNEMIIGTSLPSPQKKGNCIKIYIENAKSEELLYKFVAKCDGGWETLKDFSEDSFADWTPDEDGKYIIMVLSKKVGSRKSSDYTSRIDYIIGEVEDNLISDVIVSKSDINLGEKVQIEVALTRSPVMCKFWVKEDDQWRTVKDYSIDNSITFTPGKPGKFEALIEVKDEGSKNQFDDFRKLEFNVFPIKPVKIINIKALTKDLIINNELTFEVDASFDEKRVVLYKFIRIDDHGNMRVVQDFSSKRLVEFTEVVPGKYKLLCLVKDMYSQNRYDDRGIIYYEVIKYKPVKVLNFISDLSTPQIVGSTVEFKCICSGGNNLLYKFIIDGNSNESRGFSSENSYKWIPVKSGMYKITVLVKDSTCREDYEAQATIDYLIEDDYTQTVYIKDININKDRYILKNDRATINVEAIGDDNLLYEFVVKKEGKQVEYIEYNEDNIMEFVPSVVGKYEIEVRVKHPKSTRNYDIHSFIYLECKEFIPAKIEYILTDKKKEYILGDEIELEVIAENTENTLVKYEVEIDNREVEMTEFSKNKVFLLKPRCAGVYTVKIYCKNIRSTRDYDCKKEENFRVLAGVPVSNCRIEVDQEKIECNKNVNFYVTCDGGKDNLYEFYLMERGNWKLIQKYSKKNYYTFMPFYKGKYKILALCKSNYSMREYDDYGLCEVQCEE